MTGRLISFFLSIAVAALFSPSATAEAREFRLGVISDKPVQEKISEYAPLANYVAERLKPHGMTTGRVVVAEDLEAMLQKIRRKEVDVVLESAFWTLEMINKAGMKPKLLVWKHGVREYRTVFVVRKDSPMTRLSDLKGKVIALQDPGSTSAFQIPIAELKRVGLKTVKSAPKPSSSSFVKYQLVQHEKNQALWVIQKRADAAAFATDDWLDLAEPKRRELKIIHTTNAVLRYLASFHPELSPELTDAIAKVLVQMARDPQGQKILEKASKTRKIEPLSEKDYQSLEYVRQLMQAR